MQSGIIPVRINIGCCLDICMAHQLLSVVDGHPGPLEIGTKSMPETVGRKVIRNDGLHDFPVFRLGPKLQIQLGPKAVPHAAHAALALYRPGLRRKHWGEWLSSGRQEAGEQRGVYWDVPDPGICLGSFNGPVSAFFGSMHVDLVMVKIHIRPCECGCLARPHTGIQQGENPESGSVTF